MRRLFGLAALAAASLLASPASAADVITANSTGPSGGWQYGTGNNYQPSNTLLLQTSGGNELALRVHQRGELAPASDANGVYSFALGTTPINFDWDIGALNYGAQSAQITVTDLLNGTSFSYDPLASPNDNKIVCVYGCTSLDYQNSFQLNWTGLFDPTRNDTYSINLTTKFGTSDNPPNSLTAYAKVGSGYAGLQAAVPEPATWAMMLLGFGAIGIATRRRRAAALLTA